MHARWIRLLLLSAVAALTTAVSSWADEGSRSWQFGIDLGTTRFDDSVAGDGDFRFGLRASWHPNDRFGVELETSRSQDVLTTTLDATCVNALVRIGGAGRALTPYVKAGVGYVEIESDTFFPFTSGAGVRGSGIGVQAGAGVQWLRPGERWGARFEVASLFEDALGDDNVHTSGTVGVVYRLPR